MSAPRFVTMRLGKDSVEDIRAIDARKGGIQEPPYVLAVTCKQVPRTLATGCFAILWLGSDNSKGMATDWKQGIRAVAKVIEVDLGANHNDDSNITVSIGYIFGKSINKIDLIDSYANAYKYFSELPLVGLNDYSNQTIREIEAGPRKDVGALLSACGRASSSSLTDIFTVYPELKDMIGSNYDTEHGEQDDVASVIEHPRNNIFFGAPGTGKSYQLNKLAKECFPEKNVRRVTFYPDYTYSQFVGCFKPYAYQDDTTGESVITYRFILGPFLETYLAAVAHPAQNYLLIVEEINRANPAATFGDVFQLLDRDADGRSEYGIAVPFEMKDAIANYWLIEGDLSYDDKKAAARARGFASQQEMLGYITSELKLPPNMYIWATMNSADQGVFPMDTAFKRRWDFKYMDIDDGSAVIADKVVTVAGQSIVWDRLRRAINDLMADNKINEDKLLGPFFVSPDVLNDERFVDVFKDKVLLYLYEDAGKMKRKGLFADEAATYSELCKQFESDGVSVFKISDFSDIEAGASADPSTVSLFENLEE